MVVLSLHSTELLMFSTNFVELCTSFTNIAKLLQSDSLLTKLFLSIIKALHVPFWTIQALQPLYHDFYTLQASKQALTLLQVM